MKPLTDEQLDIAIGTILRTGVILSAILVAAGGIGYLTGHGTTPSPAELISIPPILRGAFSGQPLFIVQLGLLVLMATPIVRVIACVAGFALEHDRAYAIISAIVLTCLIFSLI
jgi:uncharacterized membrane protein